MKKKTLLKSIWILLVMCGVSANAGAQDLKSILSGVAKAVVGNKATTASSIIGTWTYSGPECQFESENLLAKAGGEMAAKEVEEKMIAVYNKVGMNNIRYTFNEDGTYSYQMKKRTVTGSYVFDARREDNHLTGKLGLKTVAYVTVTGNDMSMVFKADKLMSILKTITGAASKVNSTAATINSVAEAYDGLMLGFELKK